ncbi:MAG: hypothetical protein L6Q63_16890, partial [Giesbergeria sp.]|nr:hypothetical protein [Giesbergeria sp.]
HLAILLGKEHRPVDLWTTRIAELPTSPTGLHYDGFSLSSSTRNDEEPVAIVNINLQIIFMVVLWLFVFCNFSQKHRYFIILPNF